MKLIQELAETIRQTTQMPAKMLMARMSESCVVVMKECKREIKPMLLIGLHAQKLLNHAVMVLTQERTDNCSLITHMMFAKMLKERAWYHYAQVMCLK
jgi:hypothetical protein